MTTAITTSTPKHHLLRLAKGYHRLQSKVSGMKEAGEKVASLAIGAAETGLTAFALGATHAKFGGASGEAMVPVIGVPADTRARRRRLRRDVRDGEASRARAHGRPRGARDVRGAQGRRVRRHRRGREAPRRQVGRREVGSDRRGRRGGALIMAALNLLALQRKKNAGRAQLDALLAHPSVVAAQQTVAQTSASPVVQEALRLQATPIVQQAITLSDHPAVVAGLSDHPAVAALDEVKADPTVIRFQELSAHPDVVAHVAALSSPALTAVADARALATTGATPTTTATPPTPRPNPTKYAGSPRPGATNMPATTPTSRSCPCRFRRVPSPPVRASTFASRPRWPATIKRLNVDPSIAQYFRVTEIKIGNRSQLAASGDLPASMFSSLALWEIDFDVCESGTYVTVSVRNVDSAAHDFAAGFIGEEHANA